MVRPSGDSKEVVARWVCGQEEEESMEVEPEDETENGSRTVKKVMILENQHEMTHMPSRSWSRHFVGGRVKQMPHQVGSQETSMSEVHMDFAFLGREDDPQKTMAVFEAKERTSTMMVSAAAPKNPTGTCIPESVGSILREVGCLHGDMVVKSDQERALLSNVEDVGRFLNVSDGSVWYVVEYSSVGAIQSNGMIERATQSVSGQTRVLLSALEEKCVCSIP